MQLIILGPNIGHYTLKIDKYSTIGELFDRIEESIGRHIATLRFKRFRGRRIFRYNEYRKLLSDYDLEDGDEVYVDIYVMGGGPSIDKQKVTFIKDGESCYHDIDYKNNSDVKEFFIKNCCLYKGNPNIDIYYNGYVQNNGPFGSENEVTVCVK